MTVRPQYEHSKRRLTWPNGAISTLYNAVEPDQLRGPQHDAAWCDELAKWRYAQDTWDQLQFGLRLGDNPQTCISKCCGLTKQRLMAQIGVTNPRLYRPSVIGSEWASFKFGDYRLAWNGQRTQRQ